MAPQIERYRAFSEEACAERGLLQDDEGRWRTADGRTVAAFLHGKSETETPRFLLRTFGCQMNLRDSELMAGMLTELGYEATEELDDADFVLINTCSVRENADVRTFGEIGRLKQWKQERPGSLLGVAGCMMQVEENVQRLQRHAAHVDLVFGTHNIQKLPELLWKAFDERELTIDVWHGSPDLVEHLPSVRADGRRAWVNIIYGCDKYCTFCIVPHTRGREKSRRPGDIIAEVKRLAAEGFVEVTLLGQNVDSYGKDLGIGYEFADLLADLEAIDGIEWIRYTTSHPRDFSPKLIEFLGQSRKVCEHVHLPVQSGSDRTLRRMNRRYTRDQYLDLVNKIRASIPGVSLTTDIIVGFPGETEEDFQETLSLVEEVRYDNAFTFIYSPRIGTPAAKWEDPISEEEKKDRLERLMRLQNRISNENNQALVGKRLDVLVEGPSRKDPAYYSARTRTNKLVLFPAVEGSDGRFARVEITSAQTWNLHGKLIELKDDRSLPQPLVVL